MIPSEVIQANPAPVETRSTGSSELGREDFLSMLIAQLENQDPLNPQDGTEFTAQLAQFSSLEQMLGMRESIDSLVAVQTQAQTLGAASLIGKKVLVAGDQLEIGPAGSELPTLSYDLNQPAEVTGIELVDATTGAVAARMGGQGTKSAGMNAIDWNEFDVIPQPGLYRLNVLVDPLAEGAFAREHVESRVTGTAIQDGILYLGGAEVRLGDVKEVRE